MTNAPHALRDLFHLLTILGAIMILGEQVAILPNPSNRTMALVLTQPLTEMSTRMSFWG
jgi:hypothetical protein